MGLRLNLMRGQYKVQRCSGSCNLHYIRGEVIEAEPHETACFAQFPEYSIGFIRTTH